MVQIFTARVLVGGIQDTYMLDGRIANALGRRAGRAGVREVGPLSTESRSAVEALSIPIPDAILSIDIAEYR
jgi:hypothetical protein